MRGLLILLAFCVIARGADFPVPFRTPIQSSAQPKAAPTTVVVPPQPTTVTPTLQPPPDVVGPPPVFPKPETPRQLPNKAPPISTRLSSPKEELHAAALDMHQLLQAYPDLIVKDAKGRGICDIRYFTLYDVAPARRQEVRDALFFWVNSLSSRTAKIRRPELVPDTDGLLYRIYLSHYNWSAASWEAVAATDNTFQVPWVDRRDYEYAHYYGGNVLLRASWFIDSASDTNRNPAYYQLLYSNVVVTRNGKKVNLAGQPPANDKEFQEAWFVDLKAAKDFEIDKGAIIPDGTSLVAWHNRHLWRVPTLFGSVWQTFDINEKVDLKQAALRDFVETRFPQEWDASEYIASMPNGLQAYLLSDGKGNRVEFADPQVATEKDSALSRHSVTVRTSQSCVVCHSTGMLHFREFLPELFEGGVDLKVKDKAAQEREQAYFLSNIAQSVDEDSYRYSKAVAACNGLSAKDSTRAFANTINWYRDPVDLEQAARDCGTTVATLKAALSFSGKGRLGAMATQGRPIPRWMWDTTHFGEAMMLLEQWHSH